MARAKKEDNALNPKKEKKTTSKQAVNPEDYSCLNLSSIYDLKDIYRCYFGLLETTESSVQC